MGEQVIPVLGVTGPQGDAVARAAPPRRGDVEDTRRLLPGTLDLETWLRRKRAMSRDLDGDLATWHERARHPQSDCEAKHHRTPVGEQRRS